MDASYLSFLRTNDFRCIFRYYYGVNANTDVPYIAQNDPTMLKKKSGLDLECL